MHDNPHPTIMFANIELLDDGIWQIVTTSTNGMRHVHANRRLLHLLPALDLDVQWEMREYGLETVVLRVLFTGLWPHDIEGDWGEENRENLKDIFLAHSRQHDQ